MFKTVIRFHHKWKKPQGYDTGIKIYNCITKSRESLIVKNKNLVSWYTCGPTVYDSAHIGHASCYMKLDIIQRILRRHFNLNVITLMNITDVDDKIIARSNAEKVSLMDVSKRFEVEFWGDLEKLSINKPDCVLRVTDNIEMIKKFIQELMDKNVAYKASNGTVYFRTQSCESYGKLQNLSEPSEQKSTVKESPMDFALWKPVKPNEIFWESIWGDGRPGWHIECSALASSVFGSQIDFHAGGIDLKFPHHENEEAQSCLYHNKSQWVNYWIHCGHLHLSDTVKMSKSLKNTISISTLLENTSSDVFRMACLMSHYRKNMEFSFEYMKTAENTLVNFTNFINNCQNYFNGLIKVAIDNAALEVLVNESVLKIDEFLRDDFNTPSVLKTLNELITKINVLLHSPKIDDSDSKSFALFGALHLVLNTFDTFGISLKTKEMVSSDKSYVEIMDILNSFRQDVRLLGIANRDQTLLQHCDKVRDNLKNCGIVIKDLGKVSSWS